MRWATLSICVGVVLVVALLYALAGAQQSGGTTASPLRQALPVLIGALIGAAAGIVGTMLMIDSQDKRWLGDRKVGVYERATLHAIALMERKREAIRHGQLGAELDLTELKADLYQFRLYFGREIYRGDIKFQQYYDALGRYEAALKGHDIAEIERREGEFLNFLEELARKAFGIPGVKLRGC